MSNTGINSATNGRSGSTSSGGGNNLITSILKVKNTTTAATVVATTTTTAVGASIKQKYEIAGSATTAAVTKTTTTTSTAAAASSKTLPATAQTAAIKTNHQQQNDANSNNKLTSTHRRDNSNLVGQKDARKYQFVEPQTTLVATTTPEHASHVEQSAMTDTQTKLVYYEGKLISATLETLIKHMVPTDDYYPEHNYIFAFLLCARLFMRTHELLANISQTWEQQQQQYTKDFVDEAVHFGHMNSITLSANSASPLTQRKNSVTTTTATLTTAAVTNVAELEPKPQQRTAIQKSAQNCIRLLAEWIETFSYDFRDERLMQQVRILARKCVYIDNSLGKQVSRILQRLVGRLTVLEQYEEFLQTLHATNVEYNGQQSNLFQPIFGTSAAAAYSSSCNASANVYAHAYVYTHTHVDGKASVNSLTNSNSSGSNSNSTTPQPDDVYGIMDLCTSCAHLAHQLTAIELERLSHIGPEEFVQAFAKEYQHSVTTAAGAAGNAAHVMSSSLNDMKKTRNLESYVEWFNRLSYLTASEIVKYPKKKQRVRIIEYWIETARECFNIGNFNSLMAIIAGLNLAPIARLKKTWSKVQSAKFSVLEHQMDPTSNFNSYRSTLKAAMWRSAGATDERERIIIPFFSLFVKDLYFLNEGCSNRLPNNHINFEKCSQLAKQIMEFNEWKKVKCPFDKMPQVINYLQHNAVLNENTLSIASFECEPPENTEEKDRYKTVKAETKQQLLQQLQEQQQQQQQQQHQH